MNCKSLCLRKLQETGNLQLGGWVMKDRNEALSPFLCGSWWPRVVPPTCRGLCLPWLPASFSHSHSGSEALTS